MHVHVQRAGSHEVGIKQGLNSAAACDTGPWIPQRKHSKAQLWGPSSPEVDWHIRYQESGEG